jgi:hypothetical protein
VWETVGSSTDGQRYRTRVKGASHARNDFEASDPVTTDDLTGTHFEASGRDGLDRLDTDKTRSDLAATLAETPAEVRRLS